MTRLARIGDRSAASLTVVGFASLVAALLIAHWNPATAYELSIYASTPPPVWLGIGVAFVAAVAVAFTTGSDLYRRIALFLGGTASFAVVAMPIVRGYFFHGVHDAMTHAGTVRALTEGTMTPYGTAYPGIHTVASFVAGVTGFSVWQSTLLVPVVVVAACYLFVPLIVRAVVGTETATTVGAFSAFLLIPLHQLAASTHPHPSSQAILFTPIVLYLLVGYLRTPESDGSSWVTAIGALVVVSVGAAILFHLMQALNVILVLIALGVVQYLSRRTGVVSHWNHRTVAPVIAVSVLAYVAWLAQTPGAVDTATGMYQSLAAAVTGTAPPPGSSIGSQSESLRSIDSGPVVIALKLFAVSAVYIAAAGALVVGVLTGLSRTIGEVADTNRWIVYLVAAVLATLPVFLVYLVGNVGQYYFRQASFIMLLVTLLGAIAITYGISALSETRFRPAVGPTVVTLFVVLFLLSSLVIFNSPYIHRANKHVTDSRVSGYETTFETTGDDAVISGVVQEPERYYDAIVTLDDDGQARRSATVNSSQLRDLRGVEGSDWYLILSQNTYEREVTAYRELRFTRSDFAALDRQPAVNRILSNGDTELYFVR